MSAHPIPYHNSTEKDAIITALWRQNDVSTSVRRHNDVIFASCVIWEADNADNKTQQIYFRSPLTIYDFVFIHRWKGWYYFPKVLITSRINLNKQFIYPQHLRWYGLGENLFQQSHYKRNMRTTAPHMATIKSIWTACYHRKCLLFVHEETLLGTLCPLRCLPNLLVINIHVDKHFLICGSCLSAYEKMFINVYIYNKQIG